MLDVPATRSQQAGHHGTPWPVQSFLSVITGRMHGAGFAADPDILLRQGPNGKKPVDRRAAADAWRGSVL